ncbi:adenylate/guanylate cyclase domain-containing protein [Ramlibacter sp. PS3R-8]|uniref:adenylate/guanylate cyclase domain-containing protein n=1 Tax=Ramlibacter sp. PS3R-8 TaxID=3133437 RepID=UPI0030978A3E
MNDTAANPADAAEVTPSIRRRLAAVAFADVAGYSRLIAVNDAETVRRWKNLRTQVMEPLILQHGGRVAEIAGDAVLIEFGSAVNAVQWATQIQRVQHALQDKADPFALHLRVGINVDDLIDDDGILQGDGVNIAARIHQAGAPGQIVITASVREFVTNRLPLKFRDLGTPPMKNIAKPVRVFEIQWLDSGVVQLMPQPHLQWTSRPTLAVLPFRNGSGDLGDAYFGEGITDQIITGLSCSRSMYVIARNSTLRYATRANDTDLRQIAAELDVRFVLDGSVWRHQDHLRIKVDLLDMTENRSLWSQRFDGSGGDVFDFQDRIAASVIGALEPRLRAVEAARAGERPTESLDAFDSVLKAMSRLYRFTDDSFRETEELLERAIALDPGYAQAHAYMAWRLIFVFGENRSTDPARDRARAFAAAERALELDPEDPFVLCVAAHVQAFVGGNLELANDLYDRALSLNENSAFAWGMSALTRAYLGETDDAVSRLQNVWRLNPYDPMNFYFWIVAGIAEFGAGRYGECIAWCRKSHRANPRFLPAMRTLAAALALSGDEEGARAVGRQLLATEPHFRVSTFVQWYPLRRPDDLARLGEGLRAAGLPD